MSRIRDRPKAGALLGFALSVLFAMVMVPLTTAVPCDHDEKAAQKRMDDMSKAFLKMRITRSQGFLFV